MQIWSCDLIVTFPRGEESKLWLCLYLFLVRDMLFSTLAEDASVENAALGAERVWS